MKYRELLQLYKEGKLTETERKEIEEALEKEQALLDFILDQEEVPNFQRKKMYIRTRKKSRPHNGNTRWKHVFKNSFREVFAEHFRKWV